MYPDSLKADGQRPRRLVEIGLLLLVLLGCAGCRSQQPSVLDSTPEQTWYDRHARKLDPFRGEESPLSDRSVLSVSASGDTYCWLEQNRAEVQLWVAPLERPAQGRQVASRPLDLGFFEVSLAEDGATCLVLRQDPSLSDSRQQAVLERWDLVSGKSEEISTSASAYFLPSWLEDGTFLFAETSAGFMRVLEQRADGSRIQALAHEANYPRLIVSPLASGSYVIYDRNRPTDTHCWVRTKGQGVHYWRELWSVGHQIRLLDETVVLVRDDDENSRLLRLPEDGKLRLDGEELLSLGVADFALMQGRQVCYLERSDWGHNLKVFDLESAQVEVVPFVEGAGLGRKFQPAGAGRVCFLYESPLQPLSAGLLDLKGKALTPLRLIPGLEKVEMQVGDDQVVLGSGSPTLLEVYGAFRQTVLPRWDWARAEWLRRGGRVVISQLSYLPLEQEKAREQLLAAAKDLGETSLVLRGQSAGGTLALMALLEKPDLFKAVWADAPVTDLVNFGQLPPGDLWLEEFGDATDPVQRQRLLKLSPLHQVSGRLYPPVLVSTAPQDKAVDPRHATRFAQRIEEMAPGSPIYFLLEEQGIHGRVLPRASDQNVAVELLWQAATRGIPTP